MIIIGLIVSFVLLQPVEVMIHWMLMLGRLTILTLLFSCIGAEILGWLKALEMETDARHQLNTEVDLEAAE